ncbi:MAG: hypothetical protein GQF41_0758 [Candidatus Rifleibacterium amylolyticum]|nr:MAG: hypothetical protein GQF41_0758 [Candidatus Rifleibacterium amylolyticum]
MSARKAFTTVELITVAALLCGAIALWYYVLMQARMQSGDIEDEQSFHALSASLVGELRRDIRSSLSISSSAPGKWEIDTVSTDRECLPIRETVVYELSQDRLKVRVTRKEKTKTYDFSKASDGKEISFNIIP